MKQKHILLMLMFVAGITFTSKAQVPGVPNASSTQTIIQDLGIGKITLNYSRPNVMDREIFGKLVPYGEVWRAGANTSTAISFSENVIVQGNQVPAGSYTLFCIPNQERWTIILSKTVGDWGAYSYKPENDLIRFDVSPSLIPEKQETLTYLFENSTTKATHLILAWENVAAHLTIQSDDDAKILANIEGLMQGKEIPNLTYFNCIQYYYLNNKDSDQALAWIAKAKEDFPKRATYQLYESRFLLRKGDKDGAVKAALEGIKVSQQNKDNEYLRLNKEALSLAQSSNINK